MFLVSYFSTKEEKEKLLETFRALDLDHDGQLTKDELKQGNEIWGGQNFNIKIGYVNIMGMTNELAEEEAERVMRQLDTNYSGSIDYSGKEMELKES